MSDITKATTFMLLSTFSLSLSGLMAKYLSEVMPISLLSFVRFFVTQSVLIFILDVLQNNETFTRYVETFSDASDLYGGVSVVFSYFTTNLNAG